MWGVKFVAIAILGLILPALAYASCEYTYVEKFTQAGDALCLGGSHTYYAKALVFSDFVNGTQPSFTVYNPNPYNCQCRTDKQD